jgi:hypothetical protein
MDMPRGQIPIDRPAIARPHLRHAACSTRCVGVDVGHPRAPLWEAPGQATPESHRAEQAARTVCVGRPGGFQPVDGVLNRNFPFFLSQVIFKFKL